MTSPATRWLRGLLLLIGLVATSSAGAASVCDLSGLGHDAAAQARVHVLLSPRMPYALQEWPRMADAARQAGFAVVAYRDPRVPRNEWQAATQSQGLADLLDVPVLEEQIAAACGMLNHAPAAIVTRCGRTHAWPILGVMPVAAWRQVLQSRHNDLERQACR